MTLSLWWPSGLGSGLCSHTFQHQKGLFCNATFFFLKQKKTLCSSPYTCCVRQWSLHCLKRTSGLQGYQKVLLFSSSLPTFSLQQTGASPKTHLSHPPCGRRGASKGALPLVLPATHLPTHPTCSRPGEHTLTPKTPPRNRRPMNPKKKHTLTPSFPLLQPASDIETYFHLTRRQNRQCGID